MFVQKIRAFNVDEIDTWKDIKEQSARKEKIVGAHPGMYIR